MVIAQGDIFWAREIIHNIMWVLGEENSNNKEILNRES